jgi:hypothetical protein
VLNIENQFYSYRLDELPRLKGVFDAARPFSVVPEGFDPDFFVNLSDDEELDALRRSLEAPPDERAILKAEYELSMKKARDMVGVVTRRIATGEATGVSSVGLPTMAIEYDVKRGHLSFGGEATRLVSVAKAVSEVFDEPCRVQGDFYYPKRGFRTWHTNRFDTPGWRMYIVDVDAPRQSYFRLRVPATGEIHSEWDEKGTINFFLIDPTRLMWHCIGSETNRWSKGFLVPDDWQRHLS